MTSTTLIPTFTIKRDLYDDSSMIPRDLNQICSLISGGFVADIVARRRAGDKEAKKELPAFWCCEFTDLTGKATIANIKSFNGIMVFDFDDLEQGQAEHMKQTVLKSPLARAVQFMFTSPSYGLKIGVQTDVNKHFTHDWYRNNKLYAHCYKKLMQLLVKCDLPAPHIDGQTCNVNRACFLSHDPDLHLNPEATTISVKLDWVAEFEAEEREFQEQQAQQRKRQQKMNYNRQHADRYVEKCYQTYMRVACDGNRHVPLFTLGMSAYSAGYDTWDVAQLYERVKANGQWERGGMQPQAKAQDVYQYWMRESGVVDTRFFEPTAESWADLFAEGRHL